MLLDERHVHTKHVSSTHHRYASVQARKKASSNLEEAITRCNKLRFTIVAAYERLRERATLFGHRAQSTLLYPHSVETEFCNRVVAKRATVEKTHQLNLWKNKRIDIFTSHQPNNQNHRLFGNQRVQRPIER